MLGIPCSPYTNTTQKENNRTTHCFPSHKKRQALLSGIWCFCSYELVYLSFCVFRRRCPTNEVAFLVHHVRLGHPVKTHQITAVCEVVMWFHSEFIVFHSQPISAHRACLSRAKLHTLHFRCQGPLTCATLLETYERRSNPSARTPALSRN